MKDLLDPAEKLFNTKTPTKLQLIGMIMMAPLLGALFVVFLPAAGFALVGKVLYEELKQDATKIKLFLSHKVQNRG